MVDRIVPATENRHREISTSLIGIRDNAPVPAEPFTMWVLEDDFAAGRPDWASSGAIFTKDVRSFELVKLRLLNSSNSLLSYLGLLAGNKFIAEGFANPRFRPVVEQLMRDEMLETITVPDLIDVEAYIDQLFERFSNLQMEDRTIRVASDGSTKLPVRITEPVLHHHAHGGSSPVLALLMASYLRTFCDSGAYPAESTGQPDDPFAGVLADLGARTHSAADLVHSVVFDSGIFSPALGEATEWLDVVVEMLETLRSHGVDSAIDSALSR
jgi:fructuronate reductase